MTQQAEFGLDGRVIWDEVKVKPPKVECLQGAMLECWGIEKEELCTLKKGTGITATTAKNQVAIDPLSRGTRRLAL